MKKLISVLLCVFMAFSVVSGVAVRDTAFDIAVTAEAAETSLEKSMLPYYYSLLSDKEQEWYLQMRKAVINKKRSVRLKGSIDEKIISKLANTMFYYDVLTFNLKAIAGGTLSANGAEVEFEYNFSKESYDKMLAAMDKTANTVIKKFDEDTSTYTKIKYIHDYLVKKTDYVEEAKTAHYAYGAMAKGKAVCEGYAQAFAYICRKAGIKTVNVIGIAGGEAHMWNKVYYNKKWYNIDVTWDDPVAPLVENSSYDYFMISDEVMNRSHTPDPCEYKVPAATDDSKSYYAKYKLVASSNSEAKKLLIDQIAKAASKGKSVVTIKFSDRNAYSSFLSYIKKNDSEQLFDILDKAADKTKAKLITKGCLSNSNDDNYTYTVYVYCKGKSISDYYSDTSQLDRDTIDYFRQLGISVD